MVLRTCQHCDRKFTKTEHFKRHQRSHTKERPYECSICQKRFSRSDVLYRHTKLHESNALANPASTTNPALTPSQNADPKMPIFHSTTPSDFGAHITPQPYQSNPPIQVHSSMRSMSGHDMATMYGSAVPTPMTAAQPRPIPPHQQPVSTFNGYSNPSTSAMHTPSSAMNPPPMINMSTTNTPQIASNNDPFTSPFEFDGSANDALQFWLSQADADIDFSMLQMPDFNGSLHHSKPPSSFGAASPMATSATSNSVNSIPDARFDKVAHVWRAKVARSQYFEDLWKQVASSSSVNIFCCDSGSDHVRQSTSTRETRWGIDPAIRNQLKVEFGTPAPTPLGSRPSHQTPPARPTNFPPSEVLDISLDIYFRRIHPKAPFIHLPTFQAASAPPSLLFIMCILGLSTMSTSGGSKFVTKAFLDLRRRALTELVATDTTGSSSEEHMCAFATAFLTLQLAVLSSDIDLVAQTQVLYSTLMAVSTRQGLFNAPEASYADILPGADQMQQRWHAWARVESVRRLISCLISADWFWANNAGLNPLIHPEDIQTTLPSDDDLFNARTAQDWAYLIRAGRNFDMPLIKPRSFHLKGSLDSILILPHPIQPFTMYSLLTVMRHIICDTHHRYFAQIEDWHGADKLVPWKTYRMDFRGCCFVPTAVQLARAAINSHRHSDINVTVLWHNININLTANVEIFQLAAGRMGPAKGVQALADIEEWATTPAARRAAIHAAQTYQHLYNRKVSDTLMLNSFSSLFSAALILGLFVFQAHPEHRDPGSTTGLAAFDLMSDVDWTLVGDCGLTDPVTKPVSMYDAHQRTAVTDFINLGGPVLLGGVPVSGYVSARTVLHDFAHLMDEMGAWRPKTYSRILHIMSDVLEDT